MKMRKILLTVVAIALVAAVSITGTLMYLKAETKNATNSFTLGSVKSALWENGTKTSSVSGIGAFVDWDNQDTETQYDAPPVVTPDGSVQKAPKVENPAYDVSTNPSPVDIYVRVKVTIPASTWTTYYVNSGTLTQGYDTTNWDLQGDYYYFIGSIDSSPAGVVPPGKTTPPIFTTVKLGSSVTSSTTSAGLSIAVQAEAIQADNIVDRTDTTTYTTGAKGYVPAAFAKANT
jgi:hypothetical protein